MSNTKDQLAKMWAGDGPSIKIAEYDEPEPTAVVLENPVVETVPSTQSTAAIVRPIRFEEPVPPVFRDGILRGWFGDMVRAVRDATETPIELPLSFGLAALATACQKKFSVHVKEDYFEPVNLWPLCALQSGNRKSGVLERMFGPLDEWEEEKANELGPQIEAATSRRRTFEKRIEKMRSEASKAKSEDFRKLEAEIAELEASLPIVPTKPVLYTDDVTPEKVGMMMAEQGEKMSILSDEAGIMEIMAGRYSGSVNINVFLQAHAGTPVKVDRGSRPSVHLKHPAITIGISPQREVLTGLMQNKDFRGKGLLARFLYFVPQSPLGYRSGRTVAVPEGIKQHYATALADLLNVEQATTAVGKPIPHRLRLSHEAREIWQAFWQRSEDALRPGAKLEHLNDWGGKLPGAVARIAGLLHCADYASCITTSLEVPADTMDRATRLGEVLVEHATIAFSLMGADPAMAIARDIWSKIVERRTKAISKADAWRHLRNSKTSKDVEPAFDILVAYGYFIEQHYEPIRSGPGRKPGAMFKVNPILIREWE